MASTEQDPAQVRHRLSALAAHISNLSSEYDISSRPKSIAPESELVLKARELITTAQTPLDHALSSVTKVMEACCIRTLLHLKAFNAIPTAGTISLADIASITGAQASLLERLLRVLVGTNFITQTPEGEYAHTRLSIGYQGHAGLVYGLAHDGGLIPMAQLAEWLEAKGTLSEPHGDDAHTHNPYAWTRGQEGKTAFQIMDQNPARLAAFQKGQGNVAERNAVAGLYDFDALAKEKADVPVLVDVGGGQGYAIARIIKAYPAIRAEQCVLQDTPDVIELAKKNEMLQPGVQFQAHDYFTPQPLKHARAYHLRAIMHDHSDANCIRILKAIVPAMAPDSKVLIADNVMPETGGAVGITAFMDIMMLVIGGKERTEKGFRTILDAAGLKLDAMHKAAPPSNYAIIEASLK